MAFRFAMKEPRQLFSAAQGRVTFQLQNRGGAGTIILHREYENPDAGIDIPFGTTLPVSVWDGGVLWISATQDSVPFVLFPSEPSRGDAQQDDSLFGGIVSQVAPVPAAGRSAPVSRIPVSPTSDLVRESPAGAQGVIPSREWKDRPGILRKPAPPPRRVILK